MGMYGWVNTPNHSEDGVEMYEDIVPSRKDKRSIEVSMISSAIFYLEKMYLYIEKGVCHYRTNTCHLLIYSLFCLPQRDDLGFATAQVPSHLYAGLDKIEKSGETILMR